MQAAREGRIEAHRAWMLRSVALTFAAVTLRAQLVPMIAAGWEPGETYAVLAWSSWAPNLIAVEPWLAARRRGAAASA